MTKLSIFQVNGVWQLGRPQVEDEGDDEEDQLLEQHLQGAQPQPAIPSQTEMLTQILCLASPPKFVLTFQFDWGLRVEVEYLEHVVLAIDHLHYLLRPPLEAYEIVIHH